VRVTRLGLTSSNSAHCRSRSRPESQTPGATGRGWGQRTRLARVTPIIPVVTRSAAGGQRARCGNAQPAFHVIWLVRPRLCFRNRGFRRSRISDPAAPGGLGQRPRNDARSAASLGAGSREAIRCICRQRCLYTAVDRPSISRFDRSANGVDHWLYVRGRRGDHLEDVGCFGSAAPALLRLVEQPHVLDRNHGLVAEGLDQLTW